MPFVTPTPNDAPVLTAIAHEAKRFWGYPESWIRSWRGQLTVDRDYIQAHLLQAIREHDRCLGFYALVALDGPAGRWELDHLWVVPAAMGRGLGRALVERAVIRAGQAGARRLSIQSDPHAEGFYHRMGARTVGRVDASIGGVERWLPEMELVLGEGPISGSADGP